MGKKDINWINATKALCIIFVFLRHCGNYYGHNLGWFDGLYLPFYVNAFFFVSGYLLFWKQLSKPKVVEPFRKYVSGGGNLMLKNIIWRIVIPSMLFAILEFFPKKLIKGGAIDVGSLFYETVGGLTYWFTSALVIAELLILLMLMTRIRNIWFYVFWALMLTSLGKVVVDSAFSFVDGHSGFPWQWKHGMICTIFMAAGGLYWRYESRIYDLMKGWVTVLLLCIYIICSIFFKDYLYDGYMVSMLLIHPVGILWGILASVLLIETTKRLSKNRFLTFIGVNSIGFYFLSGAIPMTFGVICKRLPVESSVFVHLVIWLTTLVLAYTIVAMLNRYLPWVWDFRLLRKQNKIVK